MAAILIIAFSALPAFAAHASSQQDWNQLRTQIESALHIPHPLPAAEKKLYGKFQVADGVEADRASYATAYELRVPAIVYHPAGATITKHPALIVVNGHGGDKSSWYATYAGILYARAGAVVLTYDPIGEYERNSDRRSKTGQHDELIEPVAQFGPRLGGMMVTDLMMAVSYLSSRPDVDPKRIAVLGFSMGSFVTAVGCAVDTRINSCVLAGGGDLDGPGEYWDKSKAMCQSAPYKALSFLGDRGAVLMALNAKRGPTLIMNGTADQTVDIPHHEADWFSGLKQRTEELLGNRKNLFEAEFVPDGKHEPYFLAKQAALWLQDKLKFPDWTRKQIERMPESHVPQGGSMLVLGQGIPDVSRDDLHAVPEAVWDSDRSSYVYETWRDRAKQAVAQNVP